MAMRNHSFCCPFFRVKFGLIFLTILLVLPLFLPFSAVFSSADVCSEKEFVFARGSGEPLGGPNYQAFVNAVQNVFGHSAKFYELGSAPRGARYPAVSLDNLTVPLVAAVSAGELADYGASVRQGIAELQNYVAMRSRLCPQSKFILAGYSQGAHVISQALIKLDPAKIAFAATFGDPKLYLPEGFGFRPAACKGEGLSWYRAYVPDCYTEQGVLRGRQPYLPNSLIGKVGAWCNAGDFICGSYLDLANGPFAAHTAYGAQELYLHAARLIRRRLENPHALQSSAVEQHNVAFLLDTTGSMRPYAEKAKTRILELASRIVTKGGRIALFEYRDLIDSSPKKHCDFGCSLETFRQKLNQITDFSGGDDAPESLLSASLTAMNALKWQLGATKTIAVFTDAGFHDPDHDGVTLQTVARRSLEIDPVNIYIITEQNNFSQVKPLALSTGGNVLSFDDFIDDPFSLLHRPIAALQSEQFFAQPGEAITFDASASGDDLKFQWDLDFDGIFEKATSSPIVQHLYATPTSGFMQVKVSNGDGVFSTMSAKVEIKNLLEMAKPQVQFLPTSSTSAKIIANQPFFLAIDGVPVGIATTVFKELEITGLRPGQTIDITTFSLAPATRQYQRSGYFDFVFQPDYGAKLLAPNAGVGANSQSF